MRLHSWLSPKCFVGESRLDGIGVFAKEPISEGELVSVWGGIVYSTDEIVALGDTFKNFRTHPLQVVDNFYLGSSSLTAVDDAERFNHSCGANLGVKGQILVIARREISAGEELTFDYETANTEFAEFECRCKSENCRQKIDGAAWQRPEFRKVHEGWMAWFIEQRITGQQRESVMPSSATEPAPPKC